MRIITFSILLIIISCLSVFTSFASPLACQQRYINQGRYVWYGRFVSYPVIYSFPQQNILVDIVTAEGIRSYDRNSLRIQFYIGKTSNNEFWCQTYAISQRFLTEYDALRWFEIMNGLESMSLKEVGRYHNITPWIISN